jgi:hypothetical protein
VVQQVLQHCRLLWHLLRLTHYLIRSLCWLLLTVLGGVT